MMKRTSPVEQPYLYSFVIYVAGFLLFCEWLRPLELITNTDNVTVFFIYAALCFLVSFLQVHGGLSIPLKLLGIAFIIDGLYSMGVIFSQDWFSVIYEQVIFNIQVIRAQEWWNMTPLFRSLLFLILLWLMSYLLYYWFIVIKRMFVFVLLTLIYITVLDTFTVYDGHWPMVRTFILAMVALGLSSFSREMDRETIPFQGFKKAYLWAIPLLVMVIFSTLSAYALPKPSPQWPDPVPYLKSVHGGAGLGPGRVVQKVGYGENDQRLGGSFVQDDTPVFQAVTDTRRYWRIESKDTYTGKGWEDTLAEPKRMVRSNDLTYQTFTENVKVEEQKALLSFTKEARFKKLVYPYGVNSITNSPEAFQLRLHENTGEIDTLVNDNPVQIGHYQLTYDAPSFEYNQLRESRLTDPDYIAEMYLQLPEDLPNRVRHLANQIVDGKNNRYDRAKAIESYFSINGFEYSTSDVAVPNKNQDYVDQFLFETQLGYCDNFSTSMVVLLRSEGIPARWVKGFTGGEKIDVTSDVSGEPMNVYEVTSGNAHSWVEVYFPEIGWVPFEPTKGFRNNTDFHTDVNLSENEQQSTSGEANAETPDESLGAPQEEEDQSQNSNFDRGGLLVQEFIGFWLLLGALVVATVVLYMTRYRWLTIYFIRRYRKGSDAETYEKAYQYLLRVLNYKGYKRSPEQTLRNYANDVDAQLGSDDMRRLTHHYELILYRNENDLKQWPEVIELWENLIKRVLS